MYYNTSSRIHACLQIPHTKSYPCPHNYIEEKVNTAWVGLREGPFFPAPLQSLLPSLSVGGRVGCGEWSMRSLWELDISTAMPIICRLNWHGPSSTRGRGQNAAWLLFLRCLPKVFTFRVAGFPCYNVMSLPENCGSASLFATVCKRLAERGPLAACEGGCLQGWLLWVMLVAAAVVCLQV
jgi:hypothetical protein